MSFPTTGATRPGPSLWLAAVAAATLGASFPLLFPGHLGPGFLVIDGVLLAASIALTALALLRSPAPQQTRRLGIILAAAGYALGLLLSLVSNAIQLPRIVGVILVVVAIALVVAGLLRGIGLAPRSLAWLLLLLPAAAFIQFLGYGSTAELAAQLLTGVLSGLIVALPGLLAGRVPAQPAPRTAGAGVASSTDAISPAAAAPASISSPALGYVVAGIGIALVLAGIVWASVVGFYASDVPVLIGFLAVGALLAWIGQRLLKRSKRSVAQRDTEN